MAPSSDLGAEAHRNLSRRKIDDAGGNKKRRDLARTTFEQRLMFALDDGETADAGSDEDTGAFRNFRL